MKNLLHIGLFLAAICHSISATAACNKCGAPCESCDAPTTAPLPEKRKYANTAKEIADYLDTRGANLPAKTKDALRAFANGEIGYIGHGSVTCIDKDGFIVSKIGGGSRRHVPQPKFERNNIVWADGGTFLFSRATPKGIHVLSGGKVTVWPEVKMVVPLQAAGNAPSVPAIAPEATPPADPNVTVFGRKSN